MMAAQKVFRAGQIVRINKKYGEVRGPVLDNLVGAEFKVVSVEEAEVKPHGHESSQVITGDPNGWSVWGDFLDIVEEPEPKAHTTTTVEANLNMWSGERIVQITSGTGGLGLSVKPNPSRVADLTGTASLTPEQAEEIANDLLERVAEIRAGAH